MVNTFWIFLLFLELGYVLTNDSSCDELQKRFNALEQKVNEETPYLSVCAYSSGVKKGTTVITYERVTHAATNLKEGGLDTCSGVFTAGLAGTYSVSWSGYSSARGGGSSVSLAKNGGSVSGTTCTWTLQGRSIVIELKKGDTLNLRYEDWNDYGYDKISFCVNLEHAHSVNSKGERDVTLVPSPDKAKGSVDNVFYLKLRPTNRHSNEKYIQNIEDEFEANVKSNARDCSKSTEKRTCQETCNNFGFTKCDPGCKFDLDLLGECNAPPFGYYSAQYGRAMINPCFYLKFETNAFTNISQRMENMVQCRASLTFEGSKLFDMLMKVKLTNISKKYKKNIEYFIEKRKVFENISSMDKDVFSSLFRQKMTIDGLRFIRKIRANPGKYSGLEEAFNISVGENLYDAFDIGVAIEEVKILNILSEEEKKDILSRPVGRWPAHKMCLENFGLCEVWNLINGDLPAFYHKSEIVTKVIEEMDKENNIMEDQTFVATLKQFIIDHEDESYKAVLEADLQNIINLGDDLFRFVEVDRVVQKYKSENSKIATELFPSKGSIPSKYFPLNGDEESPFVALRVNLHSNRLIDVGQEVNVECDVTYEGFRGQRGPRGSSKKFRLVLQ